MVKFAKYLSISVILVSSRFIGATKLPEDCDDDKGAGSDYFASGSAHSSQFLMPGGSVLTSSRGSSISSDGIQRTFHELKKEANQYVSKSSSDGLPVPNIPGSHFFPFFKKNSYSSGQQSSFSSSQTGSSGSLPYLDEQQHSIIPVESKIPTFKQLEAKKKVVTKSFTGSSSNPEVSGEFDVEQNQGANSNANVNTYIYQPVVPAAQKDYSSNHHQESENIKVFSSNVNPVPVQQTVIYRPIPLETERVYENEANHGSESIKVSGSSVNIPSTFISEKKIYSSVPDTETSSSSHNFKSYSHRQDANTGIPSYLVNKPNTFSTNVVTFDKTNSGQNTFSPHLPYLIPTESKPSTPEEHYTSESHSERTEQKETKQFAVPLVAKVPNHVKYNEEVESVKPEELEGYGIKQVVVSQKLVEVPTDGRRTKFAIKVQAPSETVGTSQSYRKESHSQSIKTVSSDNGANSPATQINYNVQPAALSALGSQTGEHVEENVQKSGDVVQIPILVHGVPQNTGYYGSKSSSSSSHSSFSSGSHFSESAGSQNLKFTGDATSFDKGSLFDGSVDKLSIPVHDYVVPLSVSKSSSSSGYRYFSSNGQAGEQLVPNSNIYVNPENDSSFHRSHSSLLQNLANAKIGSDTELVSSSFGSPQKKTYGFSTAFSSNSSNINGKVTENREASVAVNDNGKIDSYHVKS